MELSESKSFNIDSDSELSDSGLQDLDVSLSKDVFNLNLKSDSKTSRIDIPAEKVHFGFDNMFKKDTEKDQDLASQTTAPMSLFGNKKRKKQKDKRDSFFESMFGEQGSLSKSQESKFKFF
jgi:hypothetical protein